MRSKKEPLYKSEAEMCAQFIDDIRLQRHRYLWGTAKRPHPNKDWTWECYAETAGWDILLVRGLDGFQIGVQAKLKLNADVLNQAIEDRHTNWKEAGPDCRAVLVPYGETGKLSMIAGHLGITVITIKPPRLYGSNSPYRPDLPTIDGKFEHPAGSEWFERCPTKRHKLPEYVPDVVAGAPSPVQLTDWKIRAIKIAVIIEKRGYVCRTDFSALGIDIRRWGAEGWLQRHPETNGWTRGEYCPDFRAQHPVVYEKIAADAGKWMPPAPKPPDPPAQKTLI